MMLSLPYKEVRERFHWKDNKSIRDRIKDGRFESIKVSKSKNGLRITLESVLRYEKELADYKDAREFFGKTEGQMAAMRANKVRLPYQDESEIVTEQPPALPLRLGFLNEANGVPPATAQHPLPTGPAHSQPIARRAGYCDAHKQLGCEKCQ